MNYEEEIRRLKEDLELKKSEIVHLKSLLTTNSSEVIPQIVNDVEKQWEDLSSHTKLSNNEIARYSRQLILPEIGVRGQLCLSQRSVLIVGAGGLGCPASIYLAAAGIGRLGVVDYDEVELSNLHRQILHTERRIGIPKSASVIGACQQLNSDVKFVPYHLQLNSENALNLIKHYDVVLDATDNVASRYLLNDACVLAGKPLVSGSALRFQGQLTVYNHKGGPCYRCLFPKPPPPETVTNCSDGGVLGVVPGIIGCLQALEAIKIAAGMDSSFSQRLLLFDGLDGTFRGVSIRKKSLGCLVCGDNPTITKLIDYEQFCGAGANDKDQALHILSENERIKPKEYKSMLDCGTPHVLVDVRLPVELEICHLPAPAINIPMDSLCKETSKEKLLNTAKVLESSGECVPIIVVCRQGNDSQVAVRKFKELMQDTDCHFVFKDLLGGLTSWAKQIDNTFPVY
ncbi:hypothetical protein ScPMuIL_013730 [Solemya velum]